MGMGHTHAHAPGASGGSPRRVALVSVGAALLLIGIKLGTGIATGSLAFISEAIHSGTDLVAALLALFAVGVAARPADRTHPYGHGKAEHLSALAEGAVLVAVSIWIAVVAIQRLVEGGHEVDATWWAIGVAVLIMAIDLGRTVALPDGRRRLHGHSGRAEGGDRRHVQQLGDGRDQHRLGGVERLELFTAGGAGDHLRRPRRPNLRRRAGAVGGHGLVGPAGDLREL